MVPGKSGAKDRGKRGDGATPPALINLEGIIASGGAML